MSVVLTTPVSVVTGQPITVTGTGLTNNGVIHIRITGPGDSKEVKLIQTISGTTFDMSTFAEVRAYKPGLHTVKVRDVTAATTTTAQVRVNQS